MKGLFITFEGNDGSGKSSALQAVKQELKELGYSTEEIKNMKSITLYDEILLRPSK